MSVAGIDQSYYYEGFAAFYAENRRFQSVKLFPKKRAPDTAQSTYGASNIGGFKCVCQF